MTTVFFDIDTQADFMNPAGALYVPGAEQIVPALDRLTQFARVNSIPIISTTDAHDENDPEFRTWPPHCIAGTLGQHKLTPTLLDGRATVPLAPGSGSEADAQQIILQKKSLNCFYNPNLDALLERFAAERCVVYGVATEYCVGIAAKEFLKKGKPVEIVTDAVRALKMVDGQRTLDEFVSAGGRLTTLDTVIGE